MWPPCKERQNPVSLGRASPSHSCAISSGNSTSHSGLLRAGVHMGPGKDTAVDGESGHRFGAGGEKERKESSGQSRVRKRPLGEEDFSFWSLLELQDRKTRSTLVSWAGQTNRPHRPQTPLWKTCKEALQGAQGTARCQGHPARTHRLCLPEGVHNGAPLLSHHSVVPQPGLGVDGLTHGPQHLQGLPAVPAERRGLAGAQQAMEL